MRNLSFDSSTHVYTVADKAGSRNIPSVTQIATAVTGKDLSSIPPAILEKAKARGIAIHADVEHRTFETVEGQWIKSQIGSRGFSTEVRGNGEFAGLEFAGTCDILSTDEIDDIKAIAEPELLYWTIQLNLYRLIFPGRDKLMVYWTPNTGNYKRVPVEVLTNEQMTEVMDAYREGRVLPASWPAEEKPEAPTLDLIVYKHTVGELTTNAQAILATVRKQLAGYTASNYSESNIQEAKRDKAKLNSAAKKLNEKRLELEREYMKPFDEFKNTINETCTEIKKASTMIDTVVKEVEDREKQEKRKLIEDFFIGLHCEFFDINQIWNPSWVNKTAKVKDAQAEIQAKIEKTKADLVVLDRIGEPEAKEHYLTSLNLESALAEADRIKANRERLEAARKAQETPVKPEATNTMFQPVRVAPRPAPVAPVVNQPETLERTMRVWGTMEQIVALGDFMNSNGIDFEKL